MFVDRSRRERNPIAEARRVAKSARLPAQAFRRLSWGVADQAVSSLTNAAVSVYVARTLGAVQFGAFSLAYLTYSFALNASRGLSTDPLMVRFSDTDVITWRRAVARSTGTATVVGVATGVCVLAVAILLDGTTRLAFVALGLTLPGLLLQDSWRFAFFALGRGVLAFINDAVWALILFPSLILLHAIGYANVFWFVLAWGGAAAVGAAVGPLQALVLPKVSGAWGWLVQHRDLGPRYLAIGTAGSAAGQLRGYGVGFLLGLAAVGYVGAASTITGPLNILFLGMGLVATPEAARILSRSPHRLGLFCLLLSSALAVAGLAWGAVLLIALPKGVGAWLLGAIWRPTYPLVIPQTLSIVAAGASVGAGAGLGALGAARRSLRAVTLASGAYVILAMIGAFAGGAVGTVYGAAVATWLGTALLWWQLRAALREYGPSPSSPGKATGQHRKSLTLDEHPAVGRPCAADVQKPGIGLVESPTATLPLPRFPYIEPRK